MSEKKTLANFVSILKFLHVLLFKEFTLSCESTTRNFCALECVRCLLGVYSICGSDLCETMEGGFCIQQNQY